MAELEAEAAPTPRKRATVAGPKQRGRTQPRPAPSPDRLEELVRATVTSLEDDKAENVVVLDVASRSAFADRMVVATGLAERQIEAMARHVEEALAEHGIRRIRTEASPDWVLLDAGDLVIHLFKPEARQNYALERMWGPDSPAPEEGTMSARPSDGAAGDEGPDDVLADGDDDDLDDDDVVGDEDSGDQDSGDEDEDDSMTDDETAAAPDPRKPMVDGDADDAQAGDAQDRAYIGELGDGRPGGNGDGAILPRGEALDGPAGFSFNVTGEDMQPTFPDEESGGAATLSEGANTRKKGRKD
ncbi:ribosome silencing factor [Roseomonas sp. SG15]|uniref:Ribosomal silencing factor RsfS n=1 Tax=Roseomonas indoligenes TaxID=2820811 RepID=A0A940MYG3_9PROT|nr:ribosome silencing factor [Pararoseomonas indoligenes]